MSTNKKSIFLEYKSVHQKLNQISVEIPSNRTPSYPSPTSDIRIYFPISSEMIFCRKSFIIKTTFYIILALDDGGRERNNAWEIKHIFIDNLLVARSLHYEQKNVLWHHQRMPIFIRMLCYNFFLFAIDVLCYQPEIISLLKISSGKAPFVCSKLLENLAEIHKRARQLVTSGERKFMFDTFFHRVVSHSKWERHIKRRCSW